MCALRQGYHEIFRSIGSLSLLILGLIACQRKPEVPVIAPPDLASYKESATLMVKVANKFIHETDAKKLHEVVVATQFTKAMECRDYNRECEIYRSIVGDLIAFTADNDITSEEKLLLERQLVKLEAAVRDGLRKLESHQ